MSGKCLGLSFLILLLGCSFAPGAESAGSDAQWLTVKDKDLRVVPGSALDFSGIFEMPEKGSAIHIKDGRLVDDKDAPVRFLCAATTFYRPEGGFPPHDLAEQYADEFRSRGYNLVRFHMPDAALMAGRNKDFDFDPEQLDRMYYLQAALKKRGIYWEIDVQASENGAFGDVKNRFNANAHMMHLTVHVDPSTQEHWKGMARRILAEKNPYTGLPLMADPSLVLVTLSNESGLSKTLSRKLYASSRGAAALKSAGHKKFFQQLEEKFQTWLEERYRQVDALNQAWELSGSKQLSDFSQARFPLVRVSGREWADTQQFISELERNTFSWMKAYVREIGYKGALTQYNNGTEFASGFARAGSDVVTMHAYHDHPSNLTKKEQRQQNKSKDGLYFAATAQMNISVFDTDFGFYRDLAAARVTGKPYIVDEYNTPFPNQWRREAGLLIPAYASLQQWDGICRYSNPVVLEYGLVRARMQAAITSFSTGLDPVARAGETISALLYRRGDVSPARNGMNVGIDYAFFEKQGMGFEPLPESIESSALRTGFGVSWTHAMGTNNGAPITIRLDEEKTKYEYGVFPPFRQLPEALEQKLNEIAPGVNGEIVSDTGEIHLAAGAKRMRVITGRSVAASYVQADRLGLGPLTLSSSTSGLVALSSLDGNDLSRSRHMLLVYITDARNSGMKLEKEGRRQLLVEQGRLPAQIRDGAVRLQLQRGVEGEVSLYALGLNGERREKLPVSVKGGSLAAEIHLAELQHGPTTYFEFVIE